MTRLLLVIGLLGACNEKFAERAPPPVTQRHAAGVDRGEAMRTRNAAIRTAPFDYKMTAEACTIPIPQSATAPDVTVIEVADIANAPPTRGEPGSGFETIVIREVHSGSTEIGRIFVWDRAAKKMVCATAYNLTAADPVTTALTTSKLFKNIETAAIKPDVPARMAARTGKRVRKVAIGANHFCAVIDDGTVRCFGQNDAGQCGAFNGPTIIGTPVTVPGVTDAIDIVSGSRHTCVRRKSGSVTCWGQNGDGELGPGRADARLVTQSVGTVTQLAAGMNHTCALRNDGAVLCWGNSGSARGVTKDSMDDEREPQPRRVAALGPAAEICTSSVASCARLETGGVQCWGIRYGDTPVALAGSEGATGLACGANAFEVCWVDAARKAACATSDGPVTLPELKDVTRLEFGSDHACALHVGGTLSCWGKNEWGQLGDGMQVPLPDPVPHRPLRGDPKPVKPLQGVKQLAIGSQRTAAILEDDALATWGYGPIGDGRDCSGPPCDGLVPTLVPFVK